MTEGERDREIGQAVRERSDLRKSVACLKRRLTTFNEGVAALLQDPRQDALDRVANLPDPKADALHLVELEKRLADTESFLRELGMLD